MRVAAAISRYGPMTPGHAALVRELRARDVPIVELRGTAYPEMALAEFCRQALQNAGNVDVLLLVDARSEGPARPLLRAAREACDRGAAGALWRGKAERPVLAVPISVLVTMRQRMRELGVGYFNTPFSDIVDEPATEQFWPFFCPFGGNGKPLCPGVRLTPEAAFMRRAREWCGERNLPLDDREWRPHESRLDARQRHASGFAVGVATWGGLDRDHQRHLDVLADRGLPVYQIHDCPWIDVAREILLSRVLADGHEGIFFIDHDIGFLPEDVFPVIGEAVDRRAVVGVPYCMRRAGHSLIGAFEAPVGTEIRAFEGGGCHPASYVGMGFTAIPASVAREAIEDRDCPPLRNPMGVVAHPVFSLLVQNGYYAGEDVSFCARVHTIDARETSPGSWTMGSTWRGGSRSPSGRVWLDTRPRIYHQGRYSYGLEDAACAVPRVDSLRMTSVSTREQARAGVLRVTDLDDTSRAAALGLLDEQRGGPGDHHLFRQEVS